VCVKYKSNQFNFFTCYIRFFTVFQSIFFLTSLDVIVSMLFLFRFLFFIYRLGCRKANIKKVENHSRNNTVKKIHQIMNWNQNYYKLRLRIHLSSSRWCWGCKWPAIRRKHNKNPSYASTKYWNYSTWWFPRRKIVHWATLSSGYNSSCVLTKHRYG